MRGPHSFGRSAQHTPPRRVLREVRRKKTFDFAYDGSGMVEGGTSVADGIGERGQTRFTGSIDEVTVEVR